MEVSPSKARAIVCYVRLFRSWNLFSFGNSVDNCGHWLGEMVCGRYRIVSFSLSLSLSFVLHEIKHQIETIAIVVSANQHHHHLLWKLSAPKWSNFVTNNTHKREKNYYLLTAWYESSIWSVVKIFYQDNFGCFPCSFFVLLPCIVADN